MSEQGFTQSGLDALPPPAMAQRAEEIGEARAALPTLTILALSVLAGAFIALGAMFATTVMSNGDGFPYGANRLLGGVAFSLGLILVVVAGAELFTGNNLIVMAWASRRVSTGHLLGNWALVWAGNFAGAISTAGIMYFTRQYTFGHGAVGETALTIANTKTGLGWGQAVALGIFCNALVCLAVWLSYAGPNRDRQGSRDRLPDQRIRRQRLRALGCEHVFHLDRPVREARSWLGRVPWFERAGHVEHHLGPLPLEQPGSSDAREHHRRRIDGRRRLLVRLPAAHGLTGVLEVGSLTRSGAGRGVACVSAALT
jgi:Formate/nitrite transporter